MIISPRCSRTRPRLALALALFLALPSPAPGAQPQQPAPTSQPRPAQTDPGAIRVLLTPELETTLVSQMAGRIAALRARLGGSVAKGGPVVVFDCAEASARLRMAQAEHAAAAETLEAKERLRRLNAAGDMEVSLAQAAAQKAKAATALARTQTGQCSVTAPFSGRIARIYVKPHQGVNPGQALVDMVSDGPLKLRLNVPSRLLSTLREGALFDVDITETGRTYQARVTAINARVDAVAQTVELEGRIEGSPRELLAGMSGIARFRTGR